MIQTLAEFVPAIGLYFARVLGLFLATPVFSRSNIPTTPKIVSIVAISIILVMTRGPGEWHDADLLVSALSVPYELLIGALLGYTVRLVFAVVEVAAEFLSFQMGYAAAAVFDPSTGSTASPPTRLYYMVTIMMFLATDGHHQVLSALSDSYDVIPVGAADISTINQEFFLALVYGIFETAARIAFPLIMTLLVINLSLGIIARFMPQMHVFALGFIFTMGFGFLGMAELMPSMGTAINNIIAQIPMWLPQVIQPPR